MTTTATTPTTEVRNVSRVLCFVDGAYQRELDLPRVSRWKKAFDPRLFGVLEGSEREDGRIAIFDGQHRLRLAAELGHEYVEVRVHTGLSRIQEAGLFTKLQTERQNVTPLQRWKARRFEGDPVVLAIDETARRYGYNIPPHPRGSTYPTSLDCVVRLESVYTQMGEGVLEATLSLLRRVWNGDEHSNNGYLVGGLARFVGAYGNRITDDVVTKLSMVSPIAIVRRARAQGGGGNTMVMRIYEEIRKASGVRGGPTGKRRKKPGPKRNDA